MRRAVVLQQVPFEGPARLAPALEAAGLALDVRRLDRGEEVPVELARGDVLVVLGGPLGVADLGHAAYPFLAREAALLARCLADDAPVLGICLGAQLLAHAAGSHVYPVVRPAPRAGVAPERAYEVGWAPVDFHGVGERPVLSGLSTREMTFHWHGDTFDLPRGAEHLASTETCPNQAFRVGRRAFGLQFHCEMDAGDVERLLEIDHDYAVRANGPEGPARIRADTERYLAAHRAVGDRLLQNLVRALTE